MAIENETLFHLVNGTWSYVNYLLERKDTPHPVVKIYFEAFKKGNNELIKRNYNHWDCKLYKITEDAIKEKYNR